MNADECTPRVGFAQLKSMIGRKVLFVGRVETMEGGLVRMAAPDGSKVAIQACSTFETPFAEVLGTVVDPQTIREESHVNFGENFGAYGVVAARERGLLGWLALVAKETARRCAPRFFAAHPTCHPLEPPPPPLPRNLNTHTHTDMSNYNELLKLANGPQMALFRAQ
jgi:hypothetical protein